jgi:hypothetical protein
MKFRFERFPGFAALAKSTLQVCVLGAALAIPGLTQQTSPPTGDTQPTIQALMDRLAAAELRIKELEVRQSPAMPARTPETPSASLAMGAPVPAAMGMMPSPVVTAPNTTLGAAPAASSEDDPMAHAMEIPGGPTLKIRGFFDFNYGVGSIANPLIFPVVDNACGTCGNSPTPAHSAFQSGEFDLFITSKLSEHLSFISEIVLGPDNTNVFGPDIERYQLTYKANPYFSASAGRFHTSIGYYNTAYHHGNWFSTAEGRPIMYLFEDSGGILPVHMVGLSLTGEVPNTDYLGLHWVAEIGNGLSSNSNVGATGGNAVQNFYSDRNYKATNLAAYVRPKFLSGLQMGGSWYHDGLNPTGLPEVRQNIESAYVVYLTSKWEILNEGVMLSNHLAGTAKPFRSPMAYTQIARKFGMYEPYFRYQYVRDHVSDPVNLLTGTYYGPSVGMRIDFTDYAAFKLQFNHLYQSSQLAGNGLNAQIAFTF